ncbi:hypothetical protein M422DRAFT_173980 [Sphaerobolus stellatus SS14]|uniref:Major facilitator superfamily (MFS) profile domain-containing protein n=1 Tax=Sphaerobolus stellatus (strain SS14) TaxID=990650 RepID=A0A0C9UZR7_SPHS4|nr:hypothetical protein M422DRAFT_173980 [Sphaerobolus stellatus SS14]
MESPSHCSLSPTLTAQITPVITKEEYPSKDVEANTTRNADNSPQPLGTIRKMAILIVLCSAQFFDIFNAVSTIIALPQISDDLHFAGGALQWVVTAYTLTFAAFLLFAGRLSDIYHPKPVFCFGYVMVGILSILCGVSVQPIMLIVFRAIQGIGAALTFPSALAMIAQYFPLEKEKNRAFAIFGACGAVGNVLGFIIGGVLTAKASWHWIFYVVGIIVTPFSVLSFFALPKQIIKAPAERRKLDWQGVVALAGGLILFVYGISDGNDAGWNRPQIIVTLIFSVIFIIGFFFIERTVREPAVPPRIWTTHNFLPLFLYCWSIYWYLNGVEVQLIEIFQDLWGWSALSSALHCIPIGVVGGIGTNIAGAIANYFPRRVLLIGGQVLMAVSVVLYALADTPDKYWSHVLPAMIIGMLGISTGYVGANIFIMGGAAKGEEGVIGAMMNTAFQLGATVGLASE